MDEQQILDEIAKLSDLKMQYLDELSSYKTHQVFKKQNCKKRIREVDQSIRRYNRLLSKDMRNETRQVGFEHGFDTRANQFDAVGGIVGDSLQAFLSAKGLTMGKNVSFAGRGSATSISDPIKKNLLIGGAILLVLLLIKKK